MHKIKRQHNCTKKFLQLIQDHFQFIQRLSLLSHISIFFLFLCFYNTMMTVLFFYRLAFFLNPLFHHPNLDFSFSFSSSTRLPIICVNRFCFRFPDIVTCLLLKSMKDCFIPLSFVNLITEK